MSPDEKLLLPVFFGLVGYGSDVPLTELERVWALPAVREGVMDTLLNKADYRTTKKDVKAYVGKRCKVYANGCHCCDVWRAWDNFISAVNDRGAATAAT